VKTTTTTAKQFVLDLPELGTDDVLVRASAAGFKLTRGYVHSIRSLARKAEKRPASTDRAALSLEDQFVDLVMELGILRSQVLLDSARGVARSLVASPS